MVIWRAARSFYRYGETNRARGGYNIIIPRWDDNEGKPVF